MGRLLAGCVFLWTVLQRSSQQTPEASALNCCEGDILVLLDSSGSIANFEFSRLVEFAAKLLQPFSLGRGHVRVGLLQVGTSPNLEFGLDVHTHQEGLQKALQSVTQLQGNTNTEAALWVAQRLLTETEVDVPKVLLWLTDGVQPGDVDKPISELKALGVSVLAVSTVHGNFQVLQRAVTPPLESHLYSVDIDNIGIITDVMREAIIAIIRAERLRVVRLTSHSALLQWRPVLSGDTGYYDLRYRPSENPEAEIKRVIPGDTSQVELSDLQPETSYTASLRPESNQRVFDTLSVRFTTLPALLPDVQSPAVVSVSDAGPRQTRISWGPLQPTRVTRYTVEYGALPGGHVRTLTLGGDQDSTVLTGLEPGTEYLVTVSALHADGKERAMSVRACTQEDPPALLDLQLTSVEPQEVHVAWEARQEGLRGYWLSWEREPPNNSPKPSKSSAYLPASSRSTRLTHLAHSSRVCVSPVYSEGRGEGLCCTAESQRSWLR